MRGGEGTRSVKRSVKNPEIRYLKEKLKKDIVEEGRRSRAREFCAEK